MAMLSFRVDDIDADRLQAVADARGIDCSDPLRDALRRELTRLASDNEGVIWEYTSLNPGERTLELIADWGPAEDWSDWAEAEV
jgi:hypothetical protein